MRERKTLAEKITIPILLGAIAVGFIGLRVYDYIEESARLRRIEENMINNPRVSLDTPEEYIEPVKEAIKSGRVQPGAVVRALNKERTRIREFRYDGRERGYGFSFVREYDFDANDANNQSR